MIWFLNKALIAFLVGAVVLGVGGRLWMFLVGWVLADNTGYTLRGSLEVVLFGGIIGLFAGILYLVFVTERLKKRLFEGAFFGLGTFLVVTVLPIDGRMAITAYEPVYHFPILLGFSTLFFLYGVAAVWALNKDSD